MSGSLPMEQHQLCCGPGENRKNNESGERDDSLGEVGAARVDYIGYAVFRKEYADHETTSQKDHHPNRQRNAKICSWLTLFARTFLRVSRHQGLSGSSNTFVR